MGCFSCLFSPKKIIKIEDTDRARSASRTSVDKQRKDCLDEHGNGCGDANVGVARVSDKDARSKSPAKAFTYRELCIATGMFNGANKIGEGGFGKVFKGRLETGEIVAIKQLNHEGVQGSQEFIIEVLMLSLLHHTNLMGLKGYCTDGDEKLLVYEYMPKGSLEDHLFDLSPEKVPLDWNTRIKIAVDTARGLEYLHCKANPPVIFRDLKPANILLDNDFHARLSDFGLAKLGPVGDKTHVSTRAIDPNRSRAEQNLINWSRPYFKDRRKFGQLADPAMQGRYPLRCLHHAIAITAMCLQEQPAYRPLISDVLVALEYLASQPYNPEAAGSGNHSPSPSQRDRSRY
ncbi:hypothetical protein BVRB_9g212440 [Beta vulgaris subsp. vulgaris]|nr:hypothetical protein BVRB_9g212440 [Beta vulgaris subsp. vulgaris]